MGAAMKILLVLIGAAIAAAVPWLARDPEQKKWQVELLIEHLRDPACACPRWELALRSVRGELLPHWFWPGKMD